MISWNLNLADWSRGRFEQLLPPAPPVEHRPRETDDTTPCTHSIVDDIIEGRVHFDHEVVHPHDAAQIFEASRGMLYKLTPRPLQALRLYGLMKQALYGDNKAPMPGLASSPLRMAKWLFWRWQTGVAPAEARARYVSYVDKLLCGGSDGQFQKFFEALLVDLPGGQRTAWEQSGHEEGQLKPYLWESGHGRGKLYLRLFLDQLPGALMAQYKETVAKRYFRYLVSDKTEMFHKALRPLEPIDDALFSQTISASLASKYLLDVATLPERASAFYQQIFEGSLEGCAVLDLSFMSVAEPMEGMVIESLVLCFEKTGIGQFSIDRIAVQRGAGYVTLRDRDTLCWAIAKYHALQGIHYRMSAVDHPRQHFPIADPIALSAQELLRADPVQTRKNPLLRIILAHSFLQLQTNAISLGSKRSFVHDHDEVFSCMCVEGDGFVGFAELGYTGLDENHPAFPPLTLAQWTSPPAYPGPYGDYLRDTWQPVHSFVAGAVEELSRDVRQWSLVRRWVSIITTPRDDFLEGLIPGFPKDIDSERDAFVNIVARFVHSVSFEHSIDHYGIGQHLGEICPARLRDPIPTGGQNIRGDAEQLRTRIAQLNTCDDRFKKLLANKMFYEAHPVLTYRDFFERGGYFGQNAAQIQRGGDPYVGLQTAFVHDLQSALAEKRHAFYPGLNEVAISIQF